MSEGTMTVWSLENVQRYMFAQTLCNNKRVMDAGCKYGVGATMLATSAKEVVGYDISAERIEQARNERKADNLEFECQDLELPIEIEEKFDAIVCMETLEHLQNPQAFLKQVSQLLNSPGLFIFSVPIGDRRNVDGSKIEGHLREFATEGDVLGLLQPYVRVLWIGRQEPVSFIGVASI